MWSARNVCTPELQLLDDERNNMKINMPVTNNEVFMKKGEILVSRTDLNGRITYANDTFISISGFTRDELIGSDHSIIRHPEMPSAIYKQLWESIQQGRPWLGYIKNRTKSGDFYWVETNIIPKFKNGELHEFLSVRYAMKREELPKTEGLYKDLNDNKASLTLSPIQTLIKYFSESSVVKKVSYGLGSLFIPIAWIMYQLALVQDYVLMSAFAALSLWGSALIIKLSVDVNSALESGVYALYCMADGRYKNKLNLSRNDQFGDLLRGIHVAQVNMSFQLADSRQILDNAFRLNQALDGAQSAVMVADAQFEIIYVNPSAYKIFKQGEQDFRKDLPGFDVEKVVGQSIDVFHKNPHHQRQLLENLTGSFKSEVLIGGRNMTVKANAVFNDSGDRVGYVIEWEDNTNMIKFMKDVDTVINAAVNGDFNERIAEQSREGYDLIIAKSINKLMETCSISLNEVIRVLGAMATGDLTEKITSDYSGAFGQLRDDSNTTVAKLKEMINEIILTCYTIQTAAQEIASGNNDLSHRTEEQAASIEQTAASMEELTSTVQANTQSAKHASQLAIDSSAIATKGVNDVHEMVVTMEAINQSSHKIGDIISVIDDIAFQTNILALNAAVEAARAGESGKGFAVVAVEVRNLAQRSAKAAGEIKELIQDSVNKVQGGTYLVSQAGITMNEIVTAINGVTTIMTEIADASAEQSVGISQVNQAISQMDNVTQQNAALVEQASAAAESMEEQVQNLSLVVGYFKVGNSNEANIQSDFNEVNYAPKHVARPLDSKLSVAPKVTKIESIEEGDDWEEF